MDKLVKNIEENDIIKSEVPARIVGTIEIDHDLVDNATSNSDSSDDMKILVATITGYAFVHSDRHQYDVIENDDDNALKLILATQAKYLIAGQSLPKNCNVVVSAEKVLAKPNSILIFDMPQVGENVIPLTLYV